MAIKERIYQVKIKASVPGFKNLFLEGIVISKGPKTAKKAAYEKIKAQISEQSTEAEVEVTKVKYIKNEFTINTFKTK